MDRKKPVIGEPYVVQPGDTVTEIAFQAYGDARRYIEIVECNRDTEGFKNPARLAPGTVLTIPNPDYVSMPRSLGSRSTVGRSFNIGDKDNGAA